MIGHQWKPAHEMGSGGDLHLATIQMHYVSAQATITLAEPGGLEIYDFIFNFSQDLLVLYEVAIVHELVHLVMNPLMRKKKSSAEEEHVVETFARVLVVGRVGN